MWPAAYMYMYMYMYTCSAYMERIFLSIILWSAYSYPLSYILYIAGFIVYGRVKLFSFKICYEYTVVPDGGSLATRKMVYLLIYCYICIFNNILLHFSYRLYYG